MIFNHWINVVNKDIIMNEKKEMLQLIIYENTIRRIFTKWIGRTKVTQNMREKINIFASKKKKNAKLCVFQQLKYNYTIKKLFCCKISKSIEKINMRSKQTVFQLIENFSLSRNRSNITQKGRAVKTIIQWTGWLLRRTKKAYFNEVVESSINIYKQKCYLLKITLRLEHTVLKKCLQKWKYYNELNKFNINQNEEGTQKLNIRRKEQNLNNLVDSAVVKGGYTPKELNSILHKEEDKVDETQLKVMLQLIKVWNKSEHINIYSIFNHWK